MPRRWTLLSGAIKESRLARVGRGLVLIQKGEGGDKGREQETAACTLDGDWKLRRDGGMRRGECLENNGSLAVAWGGVGASGEGMFSPSKSGWKKVGMV